MFAQAVADHLDVDVDAVEVVMGDTARFPLGIGAIASRVGVVGSNAVATSAAVVRRKALTIAADLLECAPDDLDGLDRVHFGTGQLPDEDQAGPHTEPITEPISIPT